MVIPIIDITILPNTVGIVVVSVITIIVNMVAITIIIFLIIIITDSNYTAAPRSARICRLSVRPAEDFTPEGFGA